MIHSFDVVSGSALGLIIGVSLRSILEKTDRWSLALLPLRPSELNPRPGDVPPRTALRQLLRVLLLGLVFIPLVAAPSSLLDSLIQDRRYFGYAVAVFFLLGATIAIMWRRGERKHFF